MFFTKYVWTEPLKKKSGMDVTAAMKKILNKTTKLVNLQTDLGKEFYNKDFQKHYKINHYSSFSNLKASIVERVNRSLKNIMWKYFSNKGNYKWYNIYPTIDEKYNNTIHRTTGYKPSEINRKNKKIYNIKFVSL